MIAKMKTAFQLLRDTLNEFNTDKAPRLAAALAYYTAFSIAPLVVVVIAIAGFVWNDQEVVREQLHDQVEQLAGADTADTVTELADNASNTGSGTIATIIGVVTLLLGAAGVFGQLQDALNTVWGVQPKPQGILGMLRARFLSFTMVFGVGFLLLISLVISSVLSALGGWIGSITPLSETILQIINLIISLGVITLVFAAMYKILPDAEIEWRDVWVGAFVTALLFNVGKYLIGLYIGNSSTASAYGAAGSFVILLLWIYYSAMIFLFGAEFTQVWARTFGKQIQPSKNGVMVNQAKMGSPSSRPLKPTAEKRIYVTQPLTPQTAGAQQTVVRKETPLNRVMLGIIASLATFIVGMLIGGDQRRGNVK
jgi:membrane protein